MMNTALDSAREAINDLAPRVYGGDILEKFQRKVASVRSHDEAALLVQHLEEDHRSLTTARERSFRLECAELDAQVTASRSRSQSLRSKYTDAAEWITTATRSVNERLASIIEALLSEEAAFGRHRERRLSFLSRSSRSPEELAALLIDIVRDLDAHFAEVIEHHLTELFTAASAAIGDLPLTAPLPVPHAGDLPTLVSFVDTRHDSNGLAKIVAGLQGAFFFGMISQFFTNKQLLTMPPAMVVGACMLIMLVRRNGAKETANVYKSAVPAAAQAFKQALLACVQTRCEAFEADATQLLRGSEARGVRRFEIEAERLEEERVAVAADASAHAVACGDVAARIHALKEQLQHHNCWAEEEPRR
jgi:hypothetical protein